MTVGITGTSQLDQTVNAIRAKAIHMMHDPGIFPGVVDRVKVPAGNRSYTEPKIAAVTASDLVEGVDMNQPQQLTDSLLTVSPAEVGCQVIYTRLAQATSSENIVTLITKAITNALKKAQDTDGTEMLDIFSTSLGSGSGTTATLGYLNAAQALIRGNSTEISLDKPIVVLHPYSYNDLADIIIEGKVTTSGTQIFGAAGLPEAWATKYSMGAVGGMPLFVDANIAINTNAAKGGVFVKDALVYAELWGIDIQPEEDKSLRGTELNGTICYAYGQRTDSWGRRALCPN